MTSAPTSPRVASDSGASTTTASAPSTASREPLDRLDARAAPTRDAPDAHAERHEPPLDGPPDRAVADDHHALAGELARLPALPVALAPRRLGALEADQVGEDRGDDPLRHGGRARVAGVAERDALRHVGLDPVDARREDLDDLQVRAGRRAARPPPRRSGPRTRAPVGRAKLDVVGQAAAREAVRDEDLHPMNEPRTRVARRPRHRARVQQPRDLLGRVAERRQHRLGVLPERRAGRARPGRPACARA